MKSSNSVHRLMATMLEQFENVLQPHLGVPRERVEGKFSQWEDIPEFWVICFGCKNKSGPKIYSWIAVNSLAI